jgi:transposase
MPLSAVLLFEDETIIRLFPNIHRAWSFKGEQGYVGISGRNDQRALFGTINMRTGHRVVMAERYLRQDGFQALLKEVRRVYKGRPVWMIADNATPHKTNSSLALAQRLNITLIWLPIQCSELNAMDHLWRSLKADISSNYQYSHVEEHTTAALNYVRNLSNATTLLKAGILSENFWLKAFL